jgi:hypothetical protein
MTYDPEQYLVRKAARQAEKAALAAMPELRNRDDDGEALADVIATQRLLAALRANHVSSEVLFYDL